jgi:hypothetical protein
MSISMLLPALPVHGMPPLELLTVLISFVLYVVWDLGRRAILRGRIDTFFLVWIVSVMTVVIWVECVVLLHQHGIVAAYESTGLVVIARGSFSRGRRALL